MDFLVTYGGAEQLAKASTREYLSSDWVLYISLERSVSLNYATHERHVCKYLKDKNTLLLLGYHPYNIRRQFLGHAIMALM